MERYILRREPSPERAVEFRIDYARVLNPAQHQAVVTVQGPVLVVAGAGSGKTRTLVYRVARLVESGVDPARILLLTFTRKSAAEMLRRASQLLDGRCDKVAGGTFHSFANLVLRRQGEAVGVSSSATILDRGDGEDVIDIVRAQLGLDKAEKRFPRKQTIASILSMAVNKSIDLPTLVENEYIHLLDHVEGLLAVRHAYAEYKQRQRLLDYDDLLVKLRNALATHEGFAAQLGRQYRYLMVDEYQDTNALQAEIVRLLAQSHDNVMVVGDDAQSIYRFRGADFRNILDFPNLFPGTRVITLDQNYRSTPPILDLANEIINQATEKYTKNLFSRRDPGEKPGLVQALTEPEQSRFVAQRILELREEGVPLQDIAVLFRSSFHSFDLELELGRRDIPFVKRGGFKFIETAHVKDVLAHLRVIANPADAVSWNRILLLLDGVGPKKAGEMLAALGGASPWDRLAEVKLRGQAAADVTRLASVLAEISRMREPSAQVARVLAYYEPVLRRVYRDDYPKRERDLEHFATIAERYRATGALLADLARTTTSPGEQVSRVLGYYEPVLRRVYRDDYPKRERDLEHFATIALRYRAAIVRKCSRSFSRFGWSSGWRCRIIGT